MDTKKFNEDFAAVASTPGMGPVVAPTSTDVGSGDAWPSLGAKRKKRKVKKKKKKNSKIEENRFKTYSEFNISESDSEMSTEDQAYMENVESIAQDFTIKAKGWVEFVESLIDGADTREKIEEIRLSLQQLHKKKDLELYPYDQYDDEDNKEDEYSLEEMIDDSKEELRKFLTDEMEPVIDWYENDMVDEAQKYIKDKDLAQYQGPWKDKYKVIDEDWEEGFDATNGEKKWYESKVVLTKFYPHEMKSFVDVDKIDKFSKYHDYGREKPGKIMINGHVFAK